MTRSDSHEWQPKWVFLEGVGWWPYGDLELDEYEQELEASVAGGEWRSVPNLAEAKNAPGRLPATRPLPRVRSNWPRWKRRVAEKEADSSGKVKSPPPLAGGGVTGDNPAQSETA